LNDLNGRDGILQSIAVAVDDVLVACGVKVKAKVEVEWCSFLTLALAYTFF